MCLKTESNQRACYNGIHRNSILQSSKNEGSLLFAKEHDHMSRKEKHSIWEVDAAGTLLSKAKNVHVPAFHAVLETHAGHTVPKSTVYSILARHGWKKQGLDPISPKS